MKRIALFVVLCVLAAAVAVGVQAWRWRERKLKEDERNGEESAAENTAAGRLGLKTPPLPPHPLDRRVALDDALRLEPDRRFLLAARELAGADVAAGFSDGRWILSLGQREFARVAELPDFPELMKALAPLARDWVAAAKVTGKPSRIRALRGHKEAFTAIREAQTRWSRGEHGVAVLHDAASGAAALMLLVPRAFDGDHQIGAAASDALPALALAELENVRPTAPRDVELVKTLMSAHQSALQNLANNEDLRARLAADLRQADTLYEGPLWRGADTSAWYAAATSAALLGSARTGYVLRNDATGLADELGTWPVPVAAHLSRWLKARIGADRGSLDESYETLASAKLPGARAAAELLDAMWRQSESPDPRIIEAVRLALRHFDSRPMSRLVWAEVLRIYARDLDRSGHLIASVVDEAPGGYPVDEVVLAKQRGSIDRLEQLALDERHPFPARLEGARAIADPAPKAQAGRLLRPLGRARPADVDTHERV